MPLHFMAWEKKGNGGGALDVRTASFRGMAVVFIVLCGAYCVVEELNE